MTIDLEKFSSNEEVYFYWYLQDLKRLGFVESFSYESEKIPLGEDVYEEEVVQMATKVKVEQRPLIKERQYTPDFIICWDVSALGVFIRIIGDPNGNRNAYFIAGEDLRSVIEVKPLFDQHGKTAVARMIRDWVWYQHRIYVQVVIPTAKVGMRGKVTPQNALFPSTFTPLRFFRTDKGGANRKILWEAKTIEEYISNHK